MLLTFLGERNTKGWGEQTDSTGFFLRFVFYNFSFFYFFPVREEWAERNISAWSNELRVIEVTVSSDNMWPPLAACCSVYM